MLFGWFLCCLGRSQRTLLLVVVLSTLLKKRLCRKIQISKKLSCCCSCVVLDCEPTLTVPRLAFTQGGASALNRKRTRNILEQKHSVGGVVNSLETVMAHEEKDDTEFSSTNPMTQTSLPDSVVPVWWRQKEGMNMNKGGGKRSYISGNEIGLRFGLGKWPEKDTEQ